MIVQVRARKAKPSSSEGLRRFLPVLLVVHFFSGYMSAFAEFERLRGMALPLCSQIVPARKELFSPYDVQLRAQNLPPEVNPAPRA
mmetsp:Transcript_78820/g.231307  ORF Transcript_78820/g.231307 Transcript_78820/m.231307 type:complete len:86 (-) Transcript_78820:68-325(-)